MCLAAEAIDPGSRTQQYHFEGQTRSFLLNNRFREGVFSLSLILSLSLSLSIYSCIKSHCINKTLHIYILNVLDMEMDIGLPAAMNMSQAGDLILNSHKMNYDTTLMLPNLPPTINSCHI